MKSHWREASKRVILGVIADHPNTPWPELQRLIAAAYPFGPRSHHPYKMWLKEVAACRAARVPLPPPQPDLSELGGLFDGVE